IRDLAAARARQGKSATQAIRGSIYERWHKVYQDLLTLGRHYGTIPEGHRDTWLFLSAVALSWFARAEALEHEIELLARSYTTLKGSEVKKVVKTIVARAERAARGDKFEWNGQLVDPRYRFRRATLYRWIQPLIPNELLPNLHAIIPDDVARERKKAVWDARWGDRNTGKGYRLRNAEKAARAQELRDQGMSYRKIAEALGVSLDTARRWLLI
ncbi:replication protein, partial [Helicobacter pylori]|nr:replication protein [Helicobacter pylori]MWR36327.1 replication protein [Helicobacter pylori]